MEKQKSHFDDIKKGHYRAALRSIVEFKDVRAKLEKIAEWLEHICYIMRIIADFEFDGDLRFVIDDYLDLFDMNELAIKDEIQLLVDCFFEKEKEMIGAIKKLDISKLYCYDSCVGDLTDEHVPRFLIYGLAEMFQDYCLLGINKSKSITLASEKDLFKHYQGKNMGVGGKAKHMVFVDGVDRLVFEEPYYIGKALKLKLNCTIYADWIPDLDPENLPENLEIVGILTANNGYCNMRETKLSDGYPHKKKFI